MSLIKTATNSPMRCGEPPAWTTASFSRRLIPGPVLRVEATCAIPSTASTYLLDSVAMPDRREIKFNKVLSAARIDNTLPCDVPLLVALDGSSLSGTTAFADGSSGQVFVDSDEEGELLVGSGAVAAGAFEVEVALPPVPPGPNLTATVTSPDGDTSPFSLPLTY